MMKKSPALTHLHIIGLLLLFSALFSCQNSHTAKWITVNGDPGKPNQWLCFRKEINIIDLPRKEIAQIAVDSNYWLWINDSLVIREGGLIRNANPTDTYYDEVNIAPFFKKGRNVIAVLANYYGRDGLNHNSSGKAGLYFNSAYIKSGSSWKVAVHPAFYDLTDDYPNYRLAVQNVGYNANHDFDWTSLAFNDRDWEQAKAIGAPPVAPWNHLIKRPIPQFKDYGLANFMQVEMHGDTAIAVLPYSAQVNPWFSITAKQNQKVEIFSDTYSLGSLRHAHSIKCEYICRDGMQEFEMPHWIAGEKINFIFPPDVKINALKFRETGYNTQFAGRFSCDDPFYNSLWEKCIRTLYVCTRNYYMDCPDRERSQYAGDVANMLNQSFFAFDTSIFAMNRKSLLNLVQWQRADSTLYMPYGGTFSEELPLQMLYLTGYHGIYQYFMFTGDTTTIRDVFPAIQKYHALWKTEANGLVRQRRGEWYWRDWGENIDDRLLDNVLYADALKSDMEIAAILGNEIDKEYYQKRYNDLKTAINKHYWNGVEYRSTDFHTAPDDRGNAIAVLSGVADSTKYEAITKVLKKSYFASTYMERFVLDALFQMGETDLALQRMKSRYKDMVNSPHSTIWEQWTFISPEKSSSTYNHGWSCCPLHLLPRHIAGIKPIEPGFSRYEIIPAASAFDVISCSVESPKGTIDVRIDFEQWQYLMEFYSPPGAVVKVGVPKRYYHSILKINGTIIKNDVGRKNRTVENTRLLSEDNDYFYYEFQPGKWLVEAF